MISFFLADETNRLDMDTDTCPRHKYPSAQHPEKPKQDDKKHSLALRRRPHELSHSGPDDPRLEPVHLDGRFVSCSVRTTIIFTSTLIKDIFIFLILLNT